MRTEDLISFSIDVHSPIFAPHVEGTKNLISNPGFESAFTGWTQDTDSGNVTITQESSTPDPHAGAYYCQMYSVNGGDVNGHIYQNVTVLAENRYRLSVWSRTSDIFASMQGRWGVYDVSNSAWLITREGTALFSSTEWQQSSLYFATPIGCTTVRIYLWQNFDSDSYVYYDDVKLEQLSLPATSFILDYNNYVNAYSHTSSVNLGYDTMSMSIAGTLDFMYDWLDGGLGRHIVTSEASSGIIWEGFVNQITMSVGGYVVTVGPMLNIINRGRMVYNQLSWDTVPPIGGGTVTAQWNDDFLSQGRFGILEGIISGGEGTAEEMLDLINTLMPEIAYAPSESSFNVPGNAEFSGTIECLGYGHLLNKYYYTQVYLAGEYNISTKIVDILNREPNRIYRYGLKSTIRQNSKQVGRYEDGTKTALSLIKELANSGDDNDNRHIFGVYSDRTFEYGPAPTTIAYKTRVSDGRVERYTGGFVDPWTIRPGSWLKIEDISVGRIADIVRPSEDPTLIFIESVNYQAPYNLSITSGRASTFRQRIDRLGLGGF